MRGINGDSGYPACRAPESHPSNTVGAGVPGMEGSRIPPPVTRAGKLISVSGQS